MPRIAHSIFALALAVLASNVAGAGTLRVMHTFHGGSDGAESWAAPIMAPDGSFYGTTAFGGDGAGCPVASHGGCGTVYKIAPDGTESVLYVFRGNDDGRYPQGNLVLDADGNLYGTTLSLWCTGCSARQAQAWFRAS